MRALKSILDSVGNYSVFLNVMMKGNVSTMSANPNPTVLKGTWCNSFVLLSQCQIWKGYKQRANKKRNPIYFDLIHQRKLLFEKSSLK